MSYFLNFRAEEERRSAEAFARKQKRCVYNQVLEHKARECGMSFDHFLLLQEEVLKDKDLLEFYEYSKAPAPWDSWKAKKYYEKLKVKPELETIVPGGHYGGITIKDIKDAVPFESDELAEIAKILEVDSREITYRTGRYNEKRKGSKRGHKISAYDVLMYLYKQKV